MAKSNPKDAAKLARLSIDCGFLVSHLIRQHEWRTDEQAREILSLILGLVDGSPPRLKAAPAGWYPYQPESDTFDPSTLSFVNLEVPESVCFTEATLSGLSAHQSVFNAKYGIGFDRKWLFEKGANPCLNIRESLLKKATHSSRPYRKVYHFVPKELHPYINVIKDSFDATHEREWRHFGDLVFEVTDLLFIFCPEADFKTFAPLQTNGRPTLFDLSWLDRY